MARRPPLRGAKPLGAPTELSYRGLDGLG